MKNQIRVMVVVSTVVLCSVPAMAGKIGFVDAERAVLQVDEGRIKAGELEAWAGPRREELQEMGARLTELQQQVASQQRVASSEVLERLSAEELTARRSLEDAQRSFERELNSRRDSFLGDVAVKVGTVASDYGKANDYDAIFILNAQPLIYFAETADLTDTVVRLYNERFPAKN